MGTAGQADIGDHGGLGIWDQGLMGVEGVLGEVGEGVLGDVGVGVTDGWSRGGPGPQVTCGCRCWSGGPGSRGRLVEAPQPQPRYPENKEHDTY